jgi:hypothetical protein
MADEPLLEQPHPQAVTEDELDLTAVTGGEDRGLTVEVIWREIREDGEEGPIVAKTAERFPIRSSLAIPMMTSLLRLEARINRALASEEDEADVALEKAMTAAHAKIVSIIIDRTPDAFKPAEMEGKRVQPTIELDVSQILVTLGWISGDLTVADAVAKALTSGKSGAKSEEELEREVREAEARGEAGAAESGAPLVSSDSS